MDYINTDDIEILYSVAEYLMREHPHTNTLYRKHISTFSKTNPSSATLHSNTSSYTTLPLIYVHCVLSMSVLELYARVLCVTDEPLNER